MSTTEDALGDIVITPVNPDPPPPPPPPPPDPGDTSGIYIEVINGDGAGGWVSPGGDDSEDNDEPMGGL